MQNVANAESALGIAQTVYDWIFTHVLVLETLGQLPLIAAVISGAYFGARTVRRRVEPVILAQPINEVLRRVVRTSLLVSFPLVAMVLLWLAFGIASELGWAQPVTRIAASLMTAWVVIRLASNIAGDTTWTRMIAVLS